MLVRVGLANVQVYEFHDEADGATYFWNATEGRRLAEENGLEVYDVSLPEAGMTFERILSMYPGLDTAKALALPEEALLSPLLFVTHNGRNVLIDGWHRMFMAAVIGRDLLPAYVLDPGQSASVLVGMIAGKGKGDELQEG